ncbi:MAG: terminase large subunit [Spirochaetales bacterium]|nr:terminase large subunit [Spirochaetales bacterium]
MEKTYQIYIDDVLSGREVACKWVKLSVQRHVDDLVKAESEDFPYRFDDTRAARIIDFVGFCKHVKGELKGKPIFLEPAQQFVLAMVFGWVSKVTGHRRFRYVYEEKARKNAKSTILAAIGLYMLFLDGEGGSEVYSAAVDKDQARIVWGVAREMVLQSPDFKKMLKDYSGSLVHQKSASAFKPLSRDNKNKDGLNVHCALVDEYHAHPDDQILELLKGGTGSRIQPLLWVITTAGFNRNCACKRERDRVERILDGVEQDEEYFGIIYTLDEGDDWKDPTVWKKSNPLLDVAVSTEFLEGLLRDARVRPEKENNFKVKHLNLWVDAHTRWVNHEFWKKCRISMEEEELIGRRCIAAFDLSTTTDLSGYGLCFLPLEQDEPYKMLWRFFIPEDNIDNRSEDVPYRAWINQGFIQTTYGNVIDYGEIEASVIKDAEKFNIEELNFDPWGAQGLMNSLQAQDLNCIRFSQGMKDMSPAVKHTERGILSREIAYTGNPVMDYMISCAEIYRDVNDNVKLVKPKREETSSRIDGVIMMVMAYYRAYLIQGEAPQSSVYEERGMRWI